MADSSRPVSREEGAAARAQRLSAISISPDELAKINNALAKVKPAKPASKEVVQERMARKLLDNTTFGQGRQRLYAAAISAPSKSTLSTASPQAQRSRVSCCNADAGSSPAAGSRRSRTAMIDVEEAGIMVACTGASPTSVSPSRTRTRMVVDEEAGVMVSHSPEQSAIVPAPNAALSTPPRRSLLWRGSPTAQATALPAAPLPPPAPLAKQAKIAMAAKKFRAIDRLRASKVAPGLSEDELPAARESDPSNPKIFAKTGMYHDTYLSNPECVSLKPPIQWKTMANAGDIKFIGAGIGPVNSAKIHLDYHGVKYEMFPMFPPVPDTMYPLTPMMRVTGTTGRTGHRQINGTYEINKAIIPLLYGPGKYNEEWESKIAYQLTPSLIMATIKRHEIWQWLHTSANLGWCMFQFPGSCSPQAFETTFEAGYAPFGVLHISVGAKYKLYTDLSLFAKDFKGACRGKAFFHGESPGPTDFTMYGAIAIFYYTNCQSARKMIINGGLQQWWTCMKDNMPPEKLLPADHLFDGWDPKRKRKPSAQYRPWLRPKRRCHCYCLWDMVVYLLPRWSYWCYRISSFIAGIIRCICRCLTSCCRCFAICCSSCASVLMS